MELLIAEKIKKYRKERDMTQDALASALGISPQSISKWECGDGYPDITLLPSIANFFGITVDELIGNDEISAREDIQKNYFNVIQSLPYDEQLELSLKYHRKYPRNWHIATSLMHNITRYHRDKLEEYKPLLNEICERILKECTDTTSRKNAIKSMCMICEEDELGKWMSKDTVFWQDERLDILEERYKLSGNNELYTVYRHAVNFVRAAKVVRRFHLIKDFPSNPQDALEWYNHLLKVLDCMTLRQNDSDIPDGFICEYRWVFLCLSSAYFEIGDKETGYKYLESALDLSERWVKLDPLTPLDLGNELFFGKTKLIMNAWKIELPDGKRYRHLLGITCRMNDMETMMTKSRFNFDSIRGEERWNLILEKARALTDSN